MAEQTYANTQDTGDKNAQGNRNTGGESDILRQRLQRLQDDVEGLARDVNAIGRGQAARGREAAQETGRRLEHRARENPMATLAITLIGGLIVGLLLGERHGGSR
ncbi:hypothetical protein [Rhodovibrio salinarum]|nr:hypothetical protein [Rhodovibrio salinarum]